MFLLGGVFIKKGEKNRVPRLPCGTWEKGGGEAIPRYKRGRGERSTELTDMCGG